jgi:hypothetical protein
MNKGIEKWLEILKKAEKTTLIQDGRELFEF